MDVGAAGGWSWQDDTGGEYNQGDGIYAFKGKSKGKGNGECYNCGASGHYSRESPNPQKGKSKAKVARENVITAGRRDTLQESAPRAKMEETPTRERRR